MLPYRVIPERAFASYREYLTAVGGDAIARARALEPAAVIAQVARAGLRGRGGAGFPTGTKWRTVAANACPIRDVVCNAAEGEPGTFKDRWLLRRNPYSTLEGMRIAAHAVGARRGYLAIKGSFTQEIARLRAALAEMEGALDGFSIAIVEGPEEYLFGEEKALLNVIDGEGPLPRTADSPPYEIGVGATPGSPNPAVVNNVETLARAASILRDGAEGFRALGTDDTPGAIILTLSGDVRRPGVYEVEAGAPLGELFERLGDGPTGARFIAALSGVSAKVLPAERFGVHADFGSLAMAGGSLGSAGFILLDDRVDPARVAQAVARFLFVESCNQCSACKVGLGIASHALDDRCDRGAEAAATLERAVAGAQHAPQGNRCYLPVQGALLVPSLVARFGEQMARGERGPRWPLPKLVDFDEARGAWILDEHQAFKRPDWTYREPAARPATAAPSRKPRGPVSVRIPAELADQLGQLAAQVGLDLDHEVEAALRDWLDRRAS